MHMVLRSVNLDLLTDLLIYQRKKTKENTASRIFASRKWSREHGLSQQESLRKPMPRAFGRSTR